MRLLYYFLVQHLQGRDRWNRCGEVSEKRRPYRIVAVSLYSDEADEADRVTAVLRRAGWPRANRSLVVRRALRCLYDDLAGKPPEEVFLYFMHRETMRVEASHHTAQMKSDVQDRHGV